MSAPKTNTNSKVKGWKMILEANGIQRKASVTILTLGKINFKIKKFKVNKETSALNDILEQMNLINIFRTFHPQMTIHILPKCTPNILSDKTYVGTQN